MDYPQQKQSKILVIGETCIDRYVEGSCDRISPEAPVPVMNLGRVETKTGMAGNVCLNLQAFNLNITFLTNSEKITKTRFIDEKSNYQILRVDDEKRIKPLMIPVMTDSFDAVVISDYNKGYLSTEKIFEIVESSSCPVFIDSKKSILPNRSNCYVKINDKEYSNLDERCHIDNLIITQGSEGCLFNRTLYPAEKVKVRDVVGAGDTFLSALVFGYLRYQDINKAIVLGNKAAAIAVQQPGTYVLSQTDINELLS